MSFKNVFYSLLKRKADGSTSWGDVKLRGETRPWQTMDKAEAQRAMKQLRESGWEVKLRTRTVTT